MMTELMLVEGVSDVQLISYFLQNVYGWKHEKNNPLGIDSMDENEHIEYLSKDGDYLVLCGVGGNGKKMLLRIHLGSQRKWIHIY